MDSVIEQKAKEIAFSRAEMLESFLRAFIAAKHPEVDTMEKAKEEMRNYVLEETRHPMGDDFALKITWRIVHPNTIQVPRELWEKVKKALNRVDYIFDEIGWQGKYDGPHQIRDALGAIKKAGL